jgi:hypothetical protein
MTPKMFMKPSTTSHRLPKPATFKTKGYSFEDFRDGGDEASAEMMQFDIIDETSHTEYGRVWLEEMMKRAGISEDTAHEVLKIGKKPTLVPGKSWRRTLAISKRVNCRSR